jgi:hypothetical protein
MTYYSEEINQINELGYGFEYLGQESVSKLFPIYLNTFFFYKRFKYIGNNLKLFIIK